ILDPVYEPVWDHLVALHRDACCFHTSAWAKVLHQTYNHQPFYLQFSRGHRLVALVPLMEVRSLFTGRRGVCLPFSDVCEPLIFDQEATDLVTDQLVRFARERRWRHLEIRGGKSLELAARPTARIYEHIIRPGFGFTVLAHWGSRPIASAIFFRFGKNALYKFGASDKKFQQLRANNLVMWQAIQFLARTGAEKLHFGRTECENDGL